VQWNQIFHGYRCTDIYGSWWRDGRDNVSSRLLQGIKEVVALMVAALQLRYWRDRGLERVGNKEREYLHTHSEVRPSLRWVGQLKVPEVPRRVKLYSVLFFFLQSWGLNSGPSP
jgi:hypothetical protein